MPHVINAVISSPLRTETIDYFLSAFIVWINRRDTTKNNPAPRFHHVASRIERLKKRFFFLAITRFVLPLFYLSSTFVSENIKTNRDKCQTKLLLHSTCKLKTKCKIPVLFAFESIYFVFFSFVKTNMIYINAYHTVIK